MARVRHLGKTNSAVFSYKRRETFGGTAAFRRKDVECSILGGRKRNATFYFWKDCTVSSLEAFYSKRSEMQHVTRNECIALVVLQNFTVGKKWNALFS